MRHSVGGEAARCWTEEVPQAGRKWFWGTKNGSGPLTWAKHAKFWKPYERHGFHRISMKLVPKNTPLEPLESLEQTRSLVQEPSPLKEGPIREGVNFEVEEPSEFTGNHRHNEPRELSHL